MMAAAAAGALAATALVFGLVRAAGAQMSPIHMLLAGVAVAALLAAGLQVLILIDVSANDVEILSEAGTETDVAAHPSVVRCMRRRLVADLVRRNVTLPPDKVLVWIHDPFLGGAETVENLQILYFEAQQMLLSALHRAVVEPE